MFKAHWLLLAASNLVLAPAGFAMNYDSEGRVDPATHFMGAECKKLYILVQPGDKVSEKAVVEHSGFLQELKKNRAKALSILKKWNLGQATLAKLGAIKDKPFVDFFQVCLKETEASLLHKTLDKVKHKLKDTFSNDPDSGRKESAQKSKPAAEATPAARPVPLDREVPLGSMSAPAK